MPETDLIPRSWGKGEKRKGTFPFLYQPLSVGAQSKLPLFSLAAAPAGELARSFFILHATSSSHLKWEERGGGMLPFPPVLNLFQLQTGCRSWEEDKQRSLVIIFPNLPVFSNPLHFLPTLLGEESWSLLLCPASERPSPCSWRVSYSPWEFRPQLKLCFTYLVREL